MKHRHYLAVLLTLAMLPMAGCGSSGIPAPAPQTPAEVAAQVCPPVQRALTSLRALAGLPAATKANLDQSGSVVKAVCAAGATVNNANLQALAQTALPVILDIVQVAGLSATEQNEIVVGLTVAQTLLSTAAVMTTPVKATATATTAPAP